MINVVTIHHLQWLLIVSCSVPKVWSLKDSALNNRHIRAAIGPWSPYIMWKCQNSDQWKEDAKLGYGMKGSWGKDCPNNEERIYSGILWDLITFMAKEDKFTFTLVESNDVCGRCFDRYNCSGMTGMVNSGEVDIALGRKVSVKHVTYL